MNRKHGFTLIEMLLTLSIVGIVAALTLPAINSAVQKNKVGPALRKFISTLSNANERMIQDNDIDRLSEAIESSDVYINNLDKYVRGKKDKKTLNEYRIKKYNRTTIDNIAELPIYHLSNNDAFAFEYYGKPSGTVNGRGYKGIFANVYYDINGFGKGSDRIGKDIFLFDIDDNGAVIPQGGKVERSAYGLNTDPEQSWKDGADADKCNKTTVGIGYTCAGSIADNDWKVIYKY